MTSKILLFSVVLLAGVAMYFEGPVEMEEMDDEAVKKELIEHISSIFEAFVQNDRETIKNTHSEDWFGFMIPSRTIVRDRAGYMQGADRILAELETLRYEIYDVEVRLFGNVAIVCYLARDWVKDRKSGEERMLHLRAMDIYQKKTSGWIQCASNISIVPE